MAARFMWGVIVSSIFAGSHFLACLATDIYEVSISGTVPDR